MDNLYKQECQEKLGDEYGAIVGELVSSWAWGRVKLDEYWRLFSKVEDVEEVIFSFSTGIKIVPFGHLTLFMPVALWSLLFLLLFKFAIGS